MSEIRIRPAASADVEALADWNIAMARETEGKGLDRAVVQRGVRAVIEAPSRGFYLLAESGGTRLGGLLITYEWSDWRAGDFWWIQSVYVVPPARRRGVFRTLFQQARERAREAGAVGLRLYVETQNTRAQQTYARLGMQRCHYHMYELDLASA